MSAASDLPEVGTSLSTGGLVVAGVCALVFLAVGLANYAGYGRFIATSYLVSPFVILAAAWLGGGTLLVLGAVWLLGLGSGAGEVLGFVLAAAGLLAWVVGLVGIFWLPVRLRPRWMRDVMARRTAGEDVQGEVSR